MYLSLSCRSFPTWIGKPGVIFSAVVNMQQTSRAGIPPDCAVRLAEKLTLVAFRLFSPAAMISCHWVLWGHRSGTSVCRFKCVPTWWLRELIKRMRGTLFSQSTLVCYRCALKSIWDWMKPYLVVKISSDILTEYCCQVCVLSIMFCRSVAVCWHGKLLRNQQETPRSTHMDLNCGRPTWDE